MDEVINNAISICLMWLLIGSLIWAVMDPARYADFVVRRYTQRNGKLPGRAVMVLSVVVMIVLWPKVLGAGRS